MTPKLAFDLLRRRFSQWSTPPSKRSNMGRAYRTEFQRFLWGAIFLSVYFLLVFYHLSGDDVGSENNDGIWAVLGFGVLFSALGAYFAPGWSSLAQRYSASGRRQSAARASRNKSRTESNSNSAGGKSQSSRHRGEHRSSSTSSRHSDRGTRSSSAEKQADTPMKSTPSSNESE